MYAKMETDSTYKCMGNYFFRVNIKDRVLSEMKTCISSRVILVVFLRFSWAHYIPYSNLNCT